MKYLVKLIYFKDTHFEIGTSFSVNHLNDILDRGIQSLEEKKVELDHKIVVKLEEFINKNKDDFAELGESFLSDNSELKIIITLIS